MTILSIQRSDEAAAPAERRRRSAVRAAVRPALVAGVLGVLVLALPGRDAAALQTNRPPVAATTGPYVITSLGLYIDGSPSSDPDGDPLTYAWNFGDGTTGKYYRVWKSYATRGVYTVTLVVTDSKGAKSAPVTTTVTIHEAPRAVAGGPYTGTEGGAAVLFDGRRSWEPDGDTPLTYQWTFGDGTTGTGVQPTHAYAQSGSYTATLTVRDSRGGVSNPSSAAVTIANVAPTVTAGLSASEIVAGDAVTLTGGFTDPSAQDGPWTYTIVWGDGTANATGSAATVTAPISASHTYATPGQFTATLTVRDKDGGQGSAQRAVTATEPPVSQNTAPTASAGGPYSGVEGSAVQLDGRGSSDADGDTLTYAWSFGDGSTGSGAQPSHTYAQSGGYTVTLTVTDARDGSSTPATATVTVANVAPTVSASLSKTSLAAGDSVTLTGGFTDPSAQDGPWTYTIVWGDGTANATGSAATIATPISATHVYATAGSFTATLTVRDKDAGEGTAQRTLTVTPVVTSQTVLLAGDIADCTRNEDELTAAILDRFPSATILTVGDNVYPDGTLAAFNSCYAPSWGRHKARTWPAVGNHEYTDAMPNAEGYHAYFGARAGPLGKAYYATTIGDWQIFVLNSELSMKAGSPQEVWLRAELAKNPKLCQLAIWHKPRFYSGTVTDERTIQKAAWVALYNAGVELVFGGHQHYYERFAPQNADGVADPARGIRQIIVGTGGKDAANFGTPAPNSEVRESEAFGVLKLVLGSNSYSWEFLPAENTSFTDSGSGTCH